MKKQTGITLIALVITIIVLIILAAIVINLIFGDNSVAQNGIKARFMSNYTAVEERVILYKAETYDYETGNAKLPITTKLTEDEKTNIKSLKETIERVNNSDISSADLYWIDLKLININLNHKYAIDINTELVYDYDGEEFFKQRHHIIEKEQKAEDSFYPDPTPTDIADLKIYTIEDLVRFSNDVNSGNEYEGKTVLLMNSLDFKSQESYTNAKTLEFGDFNEDGVVESLIEELSKQKGFNPIGSLTKGKYFKGNFDGNKKVIKHLYISRKEPIGLFGQIQNSTIKNLGLVDGNIVGSSSSGPSGTLAAIINGEITLQGIYNAGNVVGFGYTGGLIGMSNSAKIIQMINCYNQGKISGQGQMAGLIGSFGGGSIDLVKNCYNLGEITCSSGAGIGGLIGNCSSTNIGIMEDCYNEGKINCPAGGGIAGLIGTAGNIGTVKGCYNKADVDSNSGNGATAGLFAQGSIGIMQDCYNIGNIAEGAITGGIGSNTTITDKLINVYNKGNVTDVTSYAAGLFAGREIKANLMENCYNEGEIKSLADVSGLIHGTSKISTIKNCYNIGEISGGLNIGPCGLMATCYSIEVIDCYNEGNIIR